MKKEIKTKLSPPWIEELSKIRAMFGEDPDINIKYDGKSTVKLYVNNNDKAEALYLLLKEEHYYGNITFSVVVVPPNGESTLDCNDTVKMYEVAFKNNPVFSFIHKVENVFGFGAIYVVFKNKVVQYFNDNLNDIYGNTSTLYEDIARDIFVEEAEINNVFYCTDVVDNKLKKPLGEWP